MRTPSLSIAPVGTQDETSYPQPVGIGPGPGLDEQQPLQARLQRQHVIARARPRLQVAAFQLGSSTSSRALSTPRARDSRSAPAVGGPVVLAGDLNAPIASDPSGARQHAGNVDSPQAHGLVSVVVAAQGDADPLSEPTLYTSSSRSGRSISTTSSFRGNGQAVQVDPWVHTKPGSQRSGCTTCRSPSKHPLSGNVIAAATI